MSGRIQSIRGMHDILPPDTEQWHALESKIHALLAAYGYQQIRLPIVEHTELFSRSIGEVTDIVEKEMYTFDDRNGDSLTLRPEGTASCVRAGVEHGILYNQQRRMWYMGPMFRHERPQKGRYRQFHQVGVETFGMPGPDIDAELIMMTARLWRALGLGGVRLEVNSLGSPESRVKYRDKLSAYFSAHRDALDEDAARRLHSNPLRILDSKNPAIKSLIKGVPSLIEELDETSSVDYARLKAQLNDADIEFVENPRLVRGLDYYNKTVFEWISDDLGAQGTICAGGRYDGLVAQLGGRSTPAAGFAIGLERVLGLLEAQHVSLQTAPLHAYLVMQGGAAEKAGKQLAEQLRDQEDGLHLVTNCGGGSLKSQLKRADRSGAKLALILGEEEISQQVIIVKDLRSIREQHTVRWSELHGKDLI